MTPCDSKEPHEVSNKPREVSNQPVRFQTNLWDFKPTHEISNQPREIWSWIPWFTNLNSTVYKSENYRRGIFCGKTWDANRIICFMGTFKNLFIKWALPRKRLGLQALAFEKLSLQALSIEKWILVCRLQLHFLVVCRLWTIKIKEKRWSATPPGIPPLNKECISLDN